MAARSFEVVQDERPDPADSPSPADGGERGKPVSPPSKGAQTAMIAGLLLALKAISQRAFIALLDTFSLITATSVFWLFYSFDNPTFFQIIHATLFGLFILAINVIVRKR